MVGFQDNPGLRVTRRKRSATGQDLAHLRHSACTRIRHLLPEHPGVGRGLVLAELDSGLTAAEVFLADCRDGVTLAEGDGHCGSSRREASGMPGRCETCENWRSAGPRILPIETGTSNENQRT